MWPCVACGSENDRHLELCIFCGCPRFPEETELERHIQERLEREARKAARKAALDRAGAAFWDFVRTLILAPVSVWVAWIFFSEGKARISFSKRSETVFEVVGIYSSLLAALGMVAAASLWFSVALTTWTEGATSTSIRSSRR